ncbi:MAG: hypothetical protein AB1297_01720 [bacterium]
MKFKLFTKSHNETLLKEIDNQGGQFTAEEHAYVIEKELAEDFASKENLLRKYLKCDHTKLVSLSFLIKYIYDEGFQNILSLGAGSC